MLFSFTLLLHLDNVLINSIYATGPAPLLVLLLEVLEVEAAETQGGEFNKGNRYGSRKYLPHFNLLTLLHLILRFHLYSWWRNIHLHQMMMVCEFHWWSIISGFPPTVSSDYMILLDYPPESDTNPCASNSVVPAIHCYIGATEVF